MSGIKVRGRQQDSFPVDAEGRQELSITSPLSGFGELQTAEVTPLLQIDAVYGVRRNTETFVGASSGSVTASNGNFVCQTGTGVGGFGVVRSRVNARYRPGQNLVFQWTVLFDSANATPLSLQAAGPFNSTNGFFVGYDGDQFGVMHRTDGAHEVHEVEITTPAGGAETVTLTLNSVAYSIPVTSGTAAFNAFEIAEWLSNPANQTVWQVGQNGNKVVLFANNAGSLPGTYSISSSGALVATDARINTGASNVETWVYQPDWNGDTLDGSGPSGLTLDVSKGNVYRLDYEYLGYGPAIFYVKTPVTNRFVEFHRFSFANNRTEPNLQNPALKIGWVAASLGSTTNLTVKGASAMAGLVGRLVSSQDTFGDSQTNLSVGTTLEPIVSYRVRLVFQGKTCLKELIPKVSYVSPTGNKPVEVVFVFNATLGAQTNWSYIDEAESVTEKDSTATTITGGTEVASFVVNGGDTESLSIADIGLDSFALQRGDTLTIAARVTSGSSVEVAASLTWTED